MITLAVYILGTLLLAIGEAFALSKHTDSEQPITYYVRRMLGQPGSLLFLVGIAVWVWAGSHFFIDTDGTLPC